MASNQTKPLEQNKRLPPELLSRIFILCDRSVTHEDRAQTYIQFTAHAVCRYWRNVALRTTPLWTSIRVNEYGPWRRAKLYLIRSGPVALLDIKIWLSRPRPPGEDGTLTKWNHYAEKALQTIQFITQHGGHVSRWRSLEINAGTFIACAATMDFLTKSNLLSLESLEVSFWGASPYHPEDKQMLIALAKQVAIKPISIIPAPRLSLIAARGVPSSYLFGKTFRPQLFGLTNLFISFVGSHPSVTDVSSMLAASPNLTRLHFSNQNPSGPSNFETTATGSSAHPLVVLSSLRYLAMMHMACPMWYLSILKTLKAPALQFLALGFPGDNLDDSQAMLDFIHHQSVVSSPCFSPDLRELAFFRVRNAQPDYEPLLRAYPNITTITVKGLGPLLKRPWLVPNLTNLAVSTWDVTELKDIVLGRCGDGLPLKKVKVTWCATEEDLPPRDREQIGKLVDLTVDVLAMHMDTDSSGDSEGDDEEAGEENGEADDGAGIGDDAGDPEVAE